MQVSVLSGVGHNNQNNWHTPLEANFGFQCQGVQFAVAWSLCSDRTRWCLECVEERFLHLTMAKKQGGEERWGVVSKQKGWVLGIKEIEVVMGNGAGEGQPKLNMYENA